jgi:hypothetical protein
MAWLLSISGHVLWSRGKLGIIIMRLIAVYIVLVLVGIGIAYGVGRAVEHWSEQASLFVFLGLFFASLWAGWQLALKLT